MVRSGGYLVRFRGYLERESVATLLRLGKGKQKVRSAPQHKTPDSILNRVLSVVRSTVDKSIELSRAARR